jgi:biopolymer transport protein ExbD
MRQLRIDLSAPLHPVLGIAFLNFVFLFLLLIIFFSFFASPSGFEIRMPVSGVSAMEENRAIVKITGENVLYFNDKVVTINELKRALIKTNKPNTIIYIRSDRRASLGRVADVWDLCKGLGSARIKIIAAVDNER